jgi:phosphate transport system substrate-binding protein
MRYELNRLSIRTKLITSALALIVAGMSHASGTLVGGGATLPSIGYVGIAAANPSLSQVYGVNVSPTSLFGEASFEAGVSVSYCLTGSGTGKNILAGIANNNVQDVCPTSTVGTTTLYGFGAPAVSRTDLTQPNFIGADSPLSAADYSNYISGHANSDPVEFPVLAGSIAIAFNLVDSTGAQVTSSEVDFSNAQLCLIFSGQVTNWGDSRLASAFTLTDGGTIPGTPINVQYRSDGSGTSFSFSNHLSAACNTTTNPLETSQTFFPAPGTTGTPSPYIVQNYFAYNASLPNDGLPDGDGRTTPLWSGSSGDAALAYAIAVTSNSIGYVETANALNVNPPLQFADVEGTSPVNNFTSALTVRAVSVVTNNVIGTINNSNGTPEVRAITDPPSTKCIVLVKPADYAVPGTIPGYINPTGNYPIVAVSYLLGNSTGNGTDLSNTQTLVTAPYNSTIQGEVTTIGGTTGLQFLNIGTTFTASQVSGCYVN